MSKKMLKINNKTKYNGEIVSEISREFRDEVEYVVVYSNKHELLLEFPSSDFKSKSKNIKSEKPTNRKSFYELFQTNHASDEELRTFFQEYVDENKITGDSTKIQEIKKMMNGKFNRKKVLGYFRECLKVEQSLSFNIPANIFSTNS